MDDERKRQLKRQARDNERKSFLDAMPITLSQARNLLETLGMKLTHCDHTHRLTREWCIGQSANVDAVVEWARNNGGYCDCEVLANLADPIEDAGKFPNA